MEFGQVLLVNLVYMCHPVVDSTTPKHETLAYSASSIGNGTHRQVVYNARFLVITDSHRKAYQRCLYASMPMMTTTDAAVVAR